MKEFCLYLLTIIGFMFFGVCLNMLGQAMVWNEVYQFQNYSWYEWVLQVFWWIAWILVGVIVAEEAAG